MKEPSDTLGEPNPGHERLTADKFTGWAHIRRCRLTFDGAGGLVSAERVETNC